jgi:hypothetical protein
LIITGYTNIDGLGAVEPVSGLAENTIYGNKIVVSKGGQFPLG